MPISLHAQKEIHLVQNEIIYQDVSDTFFYNATFIDKNNGLSDNLVWSINCDSENVFWIGCQNGLNRLTGKSIIHYFPCFESYNCLTTAPIYHSLSTDKIMYFNAYKGYLTYSNTSDQLKLHYVNKSDDDLFMVAFDKTTSGEIYGISTQGLFNILDNGTTLKLFDLADSKLNNLAFIKIENDQSIWMGTKAGALIKYEIESGLYKIYHFDSKPVMIKKMIKTGADQYLLATFGRGLITLDTKNNVYSSYVFYPDTSDYSFNIVNDIMLDRDNTYWIATTGKGLLSYNLETNKFYQYLTFDDSNTEIISFSTNCLFKDSTHTVWVGTDTYGAIRLDPINQFVLPGISPVTFSLSRDDYITSVYADDMDSITPDIWVGTLTGLYKINRSTNHVLKTYNDISIQKQKHTLRNVNVIKRNSVNNKLLVGTSNGLFELDEISNYHRSIFFKVDKNTFSGSNFITDIEFDSSGIMWVSTLNGLYKQISGDLFLHIRVPPLRYKGEYTTISNSINDILFDHKNNLWLCLGYDGSQTINGPICYNVQSGKFIYINSTLFDTRIRQMKDFFEMAVDSNNNIFIATQNGLIKINMYASKLAEHLDFGEFNKYIFTQSIKLSNDSNLWCIRKDGFYKYNISDGTIIHIDDSYGFYADISNLSLIKSSENRVFIAGDNILHSFRPDKFQPRILTPKVKLLEIVVNGNRSISPSQLYNDSVLQLAYHENNLLIRFMALDYNFCNSIRYAYNITGRDTSFIAIGNLSDLFLANLAPDNYTIEIISRNRDGNWSSESNKIKVNIHPPWYKKTLFRSILAVLVVLTILLSVRLRIKNLKKGSTIKQKLFESEMAALRTQMNPHFIFNSLNSINRYIIRNNKEIASEYLIKFSKLIRSILENSKLRLIPLSEELGALRLYVELEQLRFDNQFDYLVDIDSSIDLDRSMIPPMIIQPFVENSIWHGLWKKKDKGLIQIKLSKLSDNKIVIIIQDNGHGRNHYNSVDSESMFKKKSVGINITKERLAINNESTEGVEIVDLYDDGKAIGTKVILTVKFDYNET